MPNTNVVIDPVTRIEGHLRIEAVAENGVIKDAWVSSTNYRGMETVLQGRAPEDAHYITMRICGVCPTSHGHASSMSVEAALGTKIPNGARLVRNLLEAAEFIHSHILWFYTLAALDYVDPAQALAAKIPDTYALAEQAGTSTADFKAVQDRLKKLVDAAVASGDPLNNLSIFSNGWWGLNPLDPKSGAAELYAPMPPELHLIAVAHYLEAIEMQAEAAQIVALIGGKFPHPMTSVAGGTAFSPNDDRIAEIKYRFQKLNEWVSGTMIPDTLAIAPFYKGALEYGAGCGNFLAWGVFNRTNQTLDSRYLPAGVIVTANGLSVDKADVSKVKEYVDHSWYTSDNGLNPKDGQTKAIDSWSDSSYDLDKQYSWAKAPRYDEKPMEVGPLSRMLVAYLTGGSDNAAVKSLVDTALGALGAGGHPEVLLSLLGRVAARNLECKVISDWTLDWCDELVAAKKNGQAALFEPYTVSDSKGAGLWEAPRGALGHFIDIKGGRINNYQVVTPSTWDLSPRGKDGGPSDLGPMEAALVGTPIADVERPIEAARIVRSFDP
ncbi:MAG: nickel-dependent hydrogenase large subunit [Coriobacteriia bacterium]|nr:nickel-dependent hydrogenase large subunit [Coriobacteriia bacterium]